MIKITRKLVSKFVNKEFQKTRGVGEPITMKSILDALEEKYGKDNLHEDMQYSIECDYIFGVLYQDRLIEPVAMYGKQKKILNEWRGSGSSGDWDSGDDGRGGQYAILESIRWISLKERLPRFI